MGELKGIIVTMLLAGFVIFAVGIFGAGFLALQGVETDATSKMVNTMSDFNETVYKMQTEIQRSSTEESQASTSTFSKSWDALNTMGLAATNTILLLFTLPDIITAMITGITQTLIGVGLDDTSAAVVWMFVAVIQSIALLIIVFAVIKALVKVDP